MYYIYKKEMIKKGEGMNTLTVRISDELSKKIKIYCIENNYKLKDYVAKALEEYSTKCL